MTISSPSGVPYDLKAAGMPPTYFNNIPMTATRQWPPDVHDGAMPYRPRERLMEKAFRQLCCGSCWGFCAWIAGVAVLLTGIIVVAIMLVSHFSSPSIIYHYQFTCNIVHHDHNIVSGAVDQNLGSHYPSNSAFHCYEHSVSKHQNRDCDANIYYHLYSQSSTNSNSHSELVRISHQSHHNVNIDSEHRFQFQFQINLPDPNNQRALRGLTALSPPCFVSYLNDVAPGLYTGQSWTTVGTYEFFSTAGGVPTRDALMTYTGVGLGATTTVWPLCGQYTLSTYSIAPTAIPPTTAPTITRTSVIVVTRPTSTVLPLQQQHIFLPTPSHANLAISPRQPANTTPTASAGPSKPAITASTSDRAVPIPSIQPLQSGHTTRSDKITYTTAPDRQTRTSKRDVIVQSTPRKRPPQQRADGDLARANPPPQHERMNHPRNGTMNAGIIVAIVLGSLIVVIAAIGLATRWFRHGYLKQRQEGASA